MVSQSAISFTIGKWHTFKRSKIVSMTKCVCLSRGLSYLTLKLTRNIYRNSFESLNFFRTPIPEPLGSHFAKIAHKVAKSKYFEKLKLNRRLQTNPFKMMYNMSMLRHRFSVERWWWWWCGWWWGAP